MTFGSGDEPPRARQPAGPLGVEEQPREEALPVRSGPVHLLFLDEESGRRAKRPADALLLLVATALAVVATLVADATSGSQAEVLAAFADLLGWLDPAWRVIYPTTLAFGAAIFVESVLLRRRALVRDQLVALGGLLVAGLVIARVTFGAWPALGAGLLSSSTNYPALRLSAVAVVLVVTGPALTRSARRTGIALVALSVPATLSLGIELPSSLLGGLSLAVAVASVVRFVFGSSAGFPSRNRMVTGLAELDVPVGELTVSAQQRSGAAVFEAVDLDHRPLVVLNVGRDAQDTQRVANAWRSLSFRDPGQGPSPGRIQQVEHESLMTLLAERSGVRVPVVVEVGRVASGDAILVLAGRSGPTAEDVPPAQVSDDFLGAVWQEVALLQDRGIAHGQLHAGNLLVTDDGPVVTNFALARLSATPEALRIDVAELLVSTTVLVGPDRALAAALRQLAPARVAEALPYLQRAGLTPHTRDRARDHEVGLKDLRKAVAEGAGVDVPDVAPLRRIRLQDIALMVLVAVAAYLLVSQLAEVGFDTIVDQLSQAQWQWVVTALVVAQTTYVTQAISLQGAVLERIPLLPCVVLQSAIKFINLTVPSSAGRIAINIRFLQKLGAPTVQAVAAGAVDTASETLLQIVLFLVSLPFVDLDIDVTAGGESSSGKSSAIWLAVIVIVATVAVVAVVLLVPRLRAKVMPTVRTALSSLLAVFSDPRRRVRLFGGNAATQILFAITLGLACRAYGAHVSLAELVFVNTAVSVFASILPIPGGIGVSEAGLTAGLTAVGVDPSIAFAAALTHRLCTYYLPPIGGYFSLRWLTRRGFI